MSETSEPCLWSGKVIETVELEKEYRVMARTREEAIDRLADPEMLIQDGKILFTRGVRKRELYDGPERVVTGNAALALDALRSILTRAGVDWAEGGVDLSATSDPREGAVLDEIHLDLDPHEFRIVGGKATPLNEWVAWMDVENGEKDETVELGRSTSILVAAKAAVMEYLSSRIG